MEKRNVVIYVAGQRFSLSTADSEEYVISIGEKVDTMIQGIQRDNPRFNRDTCATLAALDLCDDETKLRQMLDVLREQVKDYLRDSEELRAENEKLKDQIKELREKLEKRSAQSTPVSTPVSENTPQPKATAQSTPSAPQPAFSDNNLRTGKKNKKHKHVHNHQNPYQAKYAQPKPQVTAPAEATANATDLPDDLEFPDTPYQFNIFDTLE